MTSSPERESLELLLSGCRSLCETAKVAIRNNKSLSGGNFYGDQFHKQQLALAPQVSGFLRTVEAVAEKQIDVAAKWLLAIQSKENRSARQEALKQLELLVHGEIIPALESSSHPPNPKGQPVLPKEVAITKPLKHYLIKIIIEANACYEARCYNACSVMIRKLAEGCIIELYEATGHQQEIKNPAGNYFMLSDLVQTLLQSTHWHLQRETKATLPKLKVLGDRAAHSRLYFASRPDVDEVVPGLRVVIEEILHHAGLKP